MRVESKRRDVERDDELSTRCHVEQIIQRDGTAGADTIRPDIDVLCLQGGTNDCTEEEAAAPTASSV